jgi:ABC-type glycerol-3-phosphate transport system substrate-binding protein
MEIYGISRRRFLQVAGATMMGAAVAGCVSGEQENQPTAAPEVPAPSTIFTEPTRKLSGDLKILMWSHFVPAHDKWFDPWAQDWGKKVGVNVTVDHIDQAQIPARTAAEIQAGQGHDLIQSRRSRSPKAPRWALGCPRRSTRTWPGEHCCGHLAVRFRTRMRMSSSIRRRRSRLWTS